MKNTLLLIMVSLMLVGAASAASPVTGTLAVTINVDSAIGLKLETNASGVTLGGTTLNATLNFGTVTYYTVSGPTFTMSQTASDFTISTPVDLTVTTTNASGYTLDLSLLTADLVHTWKFGGVTLSTTPQSIVTLPTSGTRTAETLSLTVPITDLPGVTTNTIKLYGATT